MGYEITCSSCMGGDGDCIRCGGMGYFTTSVEPKSFDYKGETKEEKENSKADGIQGLSVGPDQNGRRQGPG